MNCLQKEFEPYQEKIDLYINLYRIGLGILVAIFFALLFTFNPYWYTVLLVISAMVFLFHFTVWYFVKQFTSDKQINKSLKYVLDSDFKVSLVEREVNKDGRRI